MKNSMDRDVKKLKEEGLDLDLSILGFTKFINLTQTLKSSGIKGACGYAAHMIFLVLLFIPFVGKNIYRAVVINNKRIVSKDAVYDFLKSTSANWRTFLANIGTTLIDYFCLLNKKDRLSVIAFDDTTYKKNRSEAVELLSKCWDHCENRFYKGFRLLNAIWTDGFSVVSLGFSLLSSQDEEKRYNESKKEVDPRSNSAKRREEAIHGSPNAVLKLFNFIFDKIFSHTSAVVFDSWFAMSKLIGEISKKITVVCMVKKNTQLAFRSGCIEAVYRNMKNRHRGSANIIGSVIESIKYQHDGIVEWIKCKIVFVRCKKTGDWIPLLCTDPTLSDEKIITLYGLRWKIEEFHRDVKQFLSLEVGSQSTDYDALNAYITVVYTRYLFLAYRQRFLYPKSVLAPGALFYGYSDEVKQITFDEACLNTAADALEALNAQTAMAKTPDGEDAFTLKQIQKALLDALVRNAHGESYIGNELTAIIDRQKSIEKSGSSLESRLQAMLAERQALRSQTA